MKSTKQIVVAMLLSSTYAVQLRNNQRQLTSVHGPIAPVTFEDQNKCTQTYDHGHSVTAIHDIVCPEPESGAAKAPSTKAVPVKEKKSKSEKDPAGEKRKDEKDKDAEIAAEVKKQAPKAKAKSLAQIQGPDFSKPPTPTFQDSNKCVHEYHSPSLKHDAPSPECEEKQIEQQSTHAPKKVPAKAAPAAFVQGPPPITVTVKGISSEYDLSHDMTKGGAWQDVPDAAADAKAEKAAAAEKLQADGIKAKLAKGEVEETPKKGAKDTAKGDAKAPAKEEAKAPAKEEVKEEVKEEAKPAAFAQGPPPITVTDSKGRQSEYDLKHDMTKGGAWQDVPNAAADAKALKAAAAEKLQADGIKAKLASGVTEEKPKKKSTKTPAKEATKPAAFVQGVTVTDSKGNQSEYDLKHDMTKGGAWQDVPDAAADAKALKSAAAEKLQADGIKAKLASGATEEKPKKKSTKADAKAPAKAPAKEATKPAAFVQGVTVTDSKGNQSEYDLKHDMTKGGAWQDVPDAAADAKALKAAEAEKIQADGIKAKLASGATEEKPKKGAKTAVKADSKAPAKEAKTEKKAAAPKEAAFVGGMPDATFSDSARCQHTYVSPRKAQDFGLDQDPNCDEHSQGQQEQSLHKFVEKVEKAEKPEEEAGPIEGFRMA